MTENRIYLDNQATTPPDRRVMNAVAKCSCELYGNAGSASHSFGWEASDAAEIGREQIATAVGTRANEVVITSGATESNNLAIKGLAAERKNPGHIITQPTEHKSVLETIRRLESTGWEVTLLPVDRFGHVDPDDVRSEIRTDTALVTLMAANNEVGTIQPTREIAQICKNLGVVLHVDATQAIGKIPFNLRDIPADLVSLSAHKMYGPKGVGALIVKRGVTLCRMTDGGDQEFGLRAGTLNVAGVVGLGTACEISQVEMASEAARLNRQRARLYDGIRSIADDVVMNGHPTDRLPGNLSLSFPGLDIDAFMANLDGIAVSSGSACTSANFEPSHVLTAMGVDRELALSTIRFGLGRFTTDDEVERTIDAVIAALNRSKAA